jgi:DnaJ-class molecular chaperone
MTRFPPRVRGARCWDDCKVCRGTGEYIVRDFDPQNDYPVPCETCGGDGRNYFRRIDPLVAKAQQRYLRMRRWDLVKAVVA